MVQRPYGTGVLLRNHVIAIPKYSEYMCITKQWYSRLYKGTRVHTPTMVPRYRHGTKVGVWYKKRHLPPPLLYKLYRTRTEVVCHGNSGRKNEGTNNGNFARKKRQNMAGVWYTVLKAFDVFQLLAHSKPAMTSSILFLFVPKSLPGARRYVVMRYVIWKYCR